ncbi:transposase family protein, partial [Mycobacterium simiae]
MHRLWKQEGLQRRVHSPRKRAGQSTWPPEVVADAPKVVWALDFQFDSTVDGKAIKIASMLDEHTRESLLNLVERSITAERLTDELEKCFAAAGGPPMVLRMDNGPELISQALQQFCADKVGLSYIPPGTPWNNPYIESFNNRLRRECLNRNHWTNLLEARVVIATSSTSTTQDIVTRRWVTEPPPSTLPDAATPITPWPATSTEPTSTQPGSKTGWTDYRGPA